jgi:hypothetical protein
VPSAVEQLDRARDDVLAASGTDFLRRLGDYRRLLEGDEELRAAIAQLRQEVKDAEERLTREDADFVAELLPIRQELAEREPEADDSDTEKPERYDPANRQQANKWHEWIWTLANFDAVAEDREEKIVQRDGLDSSRSRMLVAILNAKLHDLVFDFNDRSAPRPDLMDLYDRANEIGRRQVAAYRRVERLGEESGFLALMHIEYVVDMTDPDPRPLDTAEQRRALMEEAMRAPDLVNVREVLRPTEARGPLSEDERNALERVEAQCRPEVDRLHRPLRRRLEDAQQRSKRSLPKIAFGRIGWVPPVLGFIVDLASFIALVVVAIGFIAGRF